MSLDAITRLQPRVNAFVALHPEATVLSRVNNASSSGLTLAGRLIAVKDNICTQEHPTTCASKALEGFTSPFDATVVERLVGDGAVIVGKTNMDEFGMGSAGIFSTHGPVRHPLRLPDEVEGEEGHVAGGSSSGSAAAVAAGMCYAAIGTDTGGSVRLPASYCGVVGFKPTYGRCSRLGVIAYASSLDTVGILARTVHDARIVYDSMNEHDPKDLTSIPILIRTKLDARPRPDLSNPTRVLEGLRVGIPKEYHVEELGESVVSRWREVARLLESHGATILGVSAPMTRHALPCYYILAPAEASSNLARYDGFRYGYSSKGEEGAAPGKERERTRGSGLGEEVKRRVLLGAFSLSDGARNDYYNQAMRIRRRIQDEFNGIFSSPHPVPAIPEVDGAVRQAHHTEGGVDILLTPSAISGAPQFRDLSHPTSVAAAYVNDVMTVPASLAGLPAISVPCGEDEGGMPLGMQLIGQWGQDDLVLSVAEALESALAPPKA